MGLSGTSDSRWEPWLRWGLILVSLVLFAAMPDKVIDLLAAIARLIAALVVLRLAWDHGPEVKALLAAVASGRLNVEAAGLKLRAKEQDRAAIEELAVARDRLAEEELTQASRALHEGPRLDSTDLKDEQSTGEQL